MSRAQRLSYLLDRFGNEAEWNGQRMHMLVRPARWGDGECNRYLCTAPAAFLPNVGDKVKILESDYTVLRADGVFVQGERIYSWAVLELDGRWGR